MTVKSFVSLLAIALSTLPASGHEFWIDPVDHRVESGAEIVAEIRVGEAYEGSAYSYIPKNFRRFEIGGADGKVPVEGRLGDRPALKQTAPDGLAIIVHETRNYTLTYREFEKFEAFVRHKDAEWVLAAHQARGLPTDQFGEAYSRYAKSLVGVGAADGMDSRFGLETEIVAEVNPYTGDLSEGMPVTLYYREVPWPQAQIEVFEKAEDGAVSISTLRTDADGRAIVPVKPGRRYMLDAVKLREPSARLADEEGVVWESLWANLTFEVPGS